MKEIKKFIPITQRDLALMLGIGTLGAILNVYPYPLIASAAVVVGIFLVRLAEVPDKQEGTQSVEELLVRKIKDEGVEKNIDARFDQMVDDVTDELLGTYGDVAMELKDKLRMAMTEQIETYDFSKHTDRLEPMLERMTEEHRTNEQINPKGNVSLESAPINRVNIKDMGNKFKNHVEQLTGSYDYYLTMEEPTINLSGIENLKIIFESLVDSSLNTTIVLSRWKLKNSPWRILSIQRPDGEDITTTNATGETLAKLNTFDIYLLKCYYNHTEIDIETK